MSKAILVLLSILLASCSARYSPFFWEYGEWAPADFSVVERSLTAVFDWSAHPDVITSIDGTAVDKGYKKARLAPGKHQLVYEAHPAEFGTHPKGLLEVDLLPGHVYEFRIDYCYWCIPRRYSTWVDDKTTGELIWGKRPDWPSWWL
jgi:hypothetical protein